MIWLIILVIPAAIMRSIDLTTASVSWRKKRRNHRILFGEPIRWVRLDWQRKLAVFQPGQIFGYERWRGDKYGTQLWQIFVVRAVPSGQSAERIPGVRPGAETLLSAQGKDRAKRALKLIEQVKIHTDDCALDVERWSMIANRFEACEPIDDLLLRNGAQ